MTQCQPVCKNTIFAISQCIERVNLYCCHRVLISTFVLLKVTLNFTILGCFDENYELIGTSCYSLHKISKTQLEAEVEYQKIPGGHVAKVQSLYEYNQLKSYLLTHILMGKLDN